MFRRFSTNFAILSIFLDAVLILVAIAAAVTIRPQLSLSPLLQPLENVELPLTIYLYGPLLWVGTLFLASAYAPQRTYKVVDELQRVVIGVAFAALSSAGLLYLTHRTVSRALFLTFVLLSFSLLLVWRLGARLAWRISDAPPMHCRVLIVGAGKVGREVAQTVREYDWAGMELVGYLDDDLAKAENGLPVWGTLDEAPRVILAQEVDEVVIALPRRAHQRISHLVSLLHELPVCVRVVPDYFALALHRADVREFAGIPMVDLRAPALSDVERMFKRSFDLVVGGVLTLLALPVMGIVALAVKLDSPGPVLFRQQRVGENGQLFTMYKFRSMVCGADEMQCEVNERDEDGHVIHKTKHDPRITRVGRFIRRFSLDELPQLFNVLNGDLSLVGPRPELPWLVEEYDLWQRKRFVVPQGLTGWWQINGRSDKPMHLHTEEDLFYIQNYSPWLDLYILLKTPWVILRGKGAY
jgi:exopolysaccharide biosynthesis polyprenyl glycosylphosphotransferase